MLAGLLVSATLALAGGQGDAVCAADGPGVVTRFNATTVQYCGWIDPAGVEKVRSALTADSATLRIASTGGSFDAPLRLAELVRDRGLGVSVEGPCFSGCASAVLLAARQRSIGAGGIVAFHNTAYSAWLLARRWFARGDEERFRPLGERAMRELALASQAGVDPALLVQPQVAIGTLCIQPPDLIEQNGEGRFNLVSALDVWVPSRHQLERFGFQISGNYPRSRQDVESRLAGYLGSDSKLRIRYAEGGVDTSALFTRFYAIRPCGF